MLIISIKSFNTLAEYFPSICQFLRNNYIRKFQSQFKRICPYPIIQIKTIFSYIVNHDVATNIQFFLFDFTIKCEKMHFGDGSRRIHIILLERDVEVIDQRSQWESRWHTIMYHTDDPIVSYGVSKYKSGFTMVRESQPLILLQVAEFTLALRNPITYEWRRQNVME